MTAMMGYDITSGVLDTKFNVLLEWFDERNRSKLLLFHSDVGIRVGDNINLIWICGRASKISLFHCWIALIVSFETQLTSDIDVIKTEIKIKIPKVKLFRLKNVDILKQYIKTIRMIPNFYTMPKHFEIRVWFPSKLFCKSEDCSQLFLYRSICNNFSYPNLLISTQNLQKKSQLKISNGSSIDRCLNQF